MDIRCRHCGEPWELDSLHDAVDERFGFDKSNRPKGEEYTKYYDAIAKEFRRNGCSVFGSKCSGNRAPEGIGILTDLLGDDMDGLACMLEDMESVIEET